MRAPLRVAGSFSVAAATRGMLSALASRNKSAASSSLRRGISQVVQPRRPSRPSRVARHLVAPQDQVHVPDQLVADVVAHDRRSAGGSSRRRAAGARSRRATAGRTRRGTCAAGSRRARRAAPCARARRCAARRRGACGRRRQREPVRRRSFSMRTGTRKNADRIAASPSAWRVWPARCPAKCSLRQVGHGVAVAQASACRGRSAPRRRARSDPRSGRSKLTVGRASAQAR